jgi:hypothetical protein
MKRSSFYWKNAEMSVRAVRSLQVSREIAGWGAHPLAVFRLKKRRMPILRPVPTATVACGRRFRLSSNRRLRVEVARFTHGLLRAAEDRVLLDAG